MADTSRTLPPLRRGVAASPALIEARGKVAGIAAIQLTAEGVERREIVLGGVRCLDVGKADDPILLYAHGGGFRMGAPDTWFGLASRIARSAGLRVIVPDYRLAPEHPFPAGLADFIDVYRDLLDRGPVFLVGGDSAGGGLACSLVLWAQGAGMDLSGGLVLLSPWLDLTLASDTFETKADTDPMFGRAAAEGAAGDYLQGAAADQPLASPSRSLIAPLPPTLLFASASEALVGDALAFARAQVALGGSVDLSIAAGEPHVWPIIKPGAPQTQQVVDRIAAFTANLGG